MRYLTTFLTIISLAAFACKDDTLSPEEQLQEDIRIIKQYLTDNNLTANSTASGLHYIITKEGVGGHPNAQSNVKVKYKGYLTDGTVFDQTAGSQTATFYLGGLIAGWQEGIPLLKKGGKGTFFLPSYLGYGPSGSGSIPPNTVLIFEIELVDF
jgi:FKBP-type peptidyl-prolyl cis-trans isomerase FkpA